MTEAEKQLLGLLRRWKCLNRKCGHEHTGAPAVRSGWRRCPKCKGESARTHEIVAVLGVDAEASSYAVVSKRPTSGKLAAMALRFDPAVFLPPHKIAGVQTIDGDPLVIAGYSKAQIKAIMDTMMELHTEAVEQGVYRSSMEKQFAALLAKALSASNK